MYCYLSKVPVITRALLSLLFIVYWRLTLVYLLIILALPPSTPFNLNKYKLGLIKTLKDSVYKINNTTQGFHIDIKNLIVSEILKRNMFPKWLIDKSVKGYLSKVRTSGKDASKCETSNRHFYKLPYIVYYSFYTGRKISSIINKYCKDLNVTIIFSPFILSTMFSPKDFVPDSL